MFDAKGMLCLTDFLPSALSWFGLPVYRFLPPIPRLSPPILAGVSTLIVSFVCGCSQFTTLLSDLTSSLRYLTPRILADVAKLCTSIFVGPQPLNFCTVGLIVGQHYSGFHDSSVEPYQRHVCRHVAPRSSYLCVCVCVFVCVCVCVCVNLCMVYCLCSGLHIFLLTVCLFA